MIEPKDYIVAKEKGLISTAKLEAEFAINLRRFSPEDGTEINPTRFNIKPEELQAAREMLVSELANLDIMIADLEALK